MSRNRWIVVALACAQLVVCAAVVTAVWSGIGTMESFQLYYSADTLVEEDVEQSVAVGSGGELQLTNCGDVVVVADSDDEVVVRAHMVLWGEDEDDARGRGDLEIAGEGQQVTVLAAIERRRYICGDGDRGRSTVELEVHVPRDLSLYLYSGGSISVVGASARAGSPSVVLEAQADGAVSVSQVSGTMRLSSGWRGGGVTVEDVRGSVTIQSRGDVDVRGVRDGNLEVTGVSGLVSLQDIVGNRVAVRNSNEVFVSRVSVGGTLDVQDCRGDITATDVAARAYRLSTSTGDLSLSGCTQGILDISAGPGSVFISDAEEVQMVVDLCRSGYYESGGDLHFSGSLAPGGYNSVIGRAADVTIALPPDAGFDLLASTLSGRIESEFRIPSGELGPRGGQAEVNGGGPLLSIETTSGDIRLEKRAAEGL